MMNDFIDSVSDVSDELNEQTAEERAGEVGDYLKKLGEIRILVARGNNFGHMASSVNILRMLILNEWIGDRNTFTVALYCLDSLECEDQVAKMKTLIPEFQELNTPFQLYETTVKVILLNKDSHLSLGKFGICGGFDDKEQGLDTALELLNVERYVQLQPYAWHEGSNLVALWHPEQEIINLDKVYEYVDLSRRSFYLADPEVTKEDWDAIRNSPFQVQATIVRSLLREVAAEKLDLCPVYGVATLAQGYAPLYNVVSGMLARADQFKGSFPTVVLLFQEFEAHDWQWFLDCLYSPAGKQKLPRSPSETFLRWNTDHKVAKRVVTVGGPGAPPTLQQVEDAVAKLGNDQVLVVYLGPVPMVVFNLVYAKATLPPVLEGQNTTELMLNLGRPYFKIGRRVEDVAFSYPTLPLTSHTNGWQARLCDRITRTIASTDPASWAESDDNERFPPEAMMPLIEAYINPKLQRKLDKYFLGFRTFFHEELEGKLFWGLDLYLRIIEEKETAALLRVGDGEASPLLEELYQSLVDHTSGGNLNFLEAMSAGQVVDFFKKVVNDGVFLITGADPKINTGHSKVTLFGRTQALPVGNTGVDFEFTENGGKIVTNFAATFAEGSWMLPASQWLGLSAPGLGLSFDENSAIPIQGAFTLTVHAGFVLTARVRVPSQQGNILLQGTFRDTRPSITNIFQMVGGINLQTILPSQLQLLSDVEVQDFELRYNYTDNAMEYIAANFETPAERTWKLVPAVEAAGLQLQVTIDNPGSLAERSWTFLIGGQFNIGSEGATAFINAQVPQLQVRGGLDDNSKPVNIESVVRAYLGDQPLPDAIKSAQISKFSFLVDQAIGAYSFAMAVDAVWPIQIGGVKVFTITGVGFSINATSNAISPADPSTLSLIRADKTAGTSLTGSFYGSVQILPDSLDIGLSLSATYGGPEAGWTFEGRTTAPISIGDILKGKPFHFDAGSQSAYNIDSLSLVIATGDNSWTFDGAFSDWKVDFLGLTIKKASIKAGQKTEKESAILRHPALRGSSAALLAAQDGDNKVVTFAEAEADIDWLGIEINTWIKFGSEAPSWGFTWKKLTGTVKKEDNEWTGTLKFDDNVTLGSMIEDMVSWITGSRFGLEAPWNFLNSIPLSNLSLIYNFTKKTVAFGIDIGPIDLGFARIDSIQVSYGAKPNDPNNKRGVMVSLKGSFPWNIGKKANGDSSTLGPWDASQPGSAPAPPGNGNKYLDLRLLAMGQHVHVTDLEKSTSVQDAIALLKKLPVPVSDPPTIPPITFDAQSAWLFGTEFGVLRLDDKENGGDGGNAALVKAGRDRLALLKDQAAANYFMTLQIVFNDPHFYALRIALDGEPAKIFKGLDFQILYRQISDTVGVYQSEITLPDVMRHLSIGAYSITLPVFGIAVYTNGDFQVDVGFPWNSNFARSFTIEGIIYPGIPVLGSAGFYFGKLSSATTNRVPQTTLGTFNPVIVFGFGLQVGFGK